MLPAIYCISDYRFCSGEYFDSSDFVVVICNGEGMVRVSTGVYVMS